MNNRRKVVYNSKKWICAKNQIAIKMLIFAVKMAKKHIINGLITIPLQYIMMFSKKKINMMFNDIIG